MDNAEYGELAKRINDERRRIAKVLHDDVMQCLATCLLKMQLCTRLVETGRYGSLVSELRSLTEAANEAVDKVHNVACGLNEPLNEEVVPHDPSLPRQPCRS